MSQFHKLAVKSIDRQTEKAVQIFFEVPEKLKDTFKYQPGQYITLSIEIDGKEVRRSYSICTTPEEGLAVVVKAIENGVFSNYANDILKVGDIVNIMPPEGNFVIENQNKNSNYCAFVAGSGITPVMSLMKAVLNFNDTSQFILVYGNKSPMQTIFFEEIIELQKHFPERLFVEHVYSEIQDSDSHFGRIEKPTVNYVLKNKYRAIDIDSFYLCGPEPMIENVQSILKENGITDERIKYELFYSEKEGKDIENTDGKTKLKVIVDDEIHELIMDRDNVILNAILDKDIDVPYSCQGGICSSCIAQIKEGKAEMRKNQILTDAEVEQGLILTCQAQPQTSEVVVDYDDI